MLYTYTVYSESNVGEKPIRCEITTRVEEIKQMIIKKHEGSVQDIVICLGTFDKDSHLDPKMRLCDQGVNTEGDYNLIYDFVPINHPLLTTAF